MNELNKLYKAMLLSWGAVVKDDGRIVYKTSGEEFPIRIDGMELYLPLSEVLDGNTVDKVFFHPACENITSKETEVFKIIRRMTTMKLVDMFSTYPAVLFAVSGTKEKRSWKQDILDMLEPLKAVKRSVKDEISALLKHMDVEVNENGMDYRFIHFKVSKGGGRSKVTGERVYYKTKPSFPFYNELVKRLARSEGQSDNQMIEFDGQSFSRHAIKLAVHIFQSVIPAVLSPDDVEFESTSAVAARLISYLGCYTEIAEQLNRIQNLFRVEFDKFGIFNIDVNWTEHMEDLPEIYRQVPIMDYNSHNTQEEEKESAQSNLGNLFSINRQNNPQQGQVQQPQQQQQLGTTLGDFDTTPPPMQAGDRYVRTEIDSINNRVYHHAVNPHTGANVVYHCTKFGNLLQRVENSMMNPLGMGVGLGMGMNMQPGMPGLNNMGLNVGMNPTGMGMNMAGAQMLPNGQIMLANGVVVNGYAQPPVTASAAAAGSYGTPSMDSGTASVATF